MTTQPIKPGSGAEGLQIKKGLWERLFESWWIPVFVVPAVVGFILNLLGFNSGLTFGALPTLALMLVLLWARNKQRRNRLELVACRDRSFECWLRRPHAIRDSLSHRWAYGTCVLDSGTLAFQPRGVDEQPMGSASVFTGLARLGQREIPPSERRGVNRSWRAVALRTNQGEIELLTPPEANIVLADLDVAD